MMSRTIGDVDAPLAIPEPSLTAYLSLVPTRLISASDGLWDALSMKSVQNISKHNHNAATSAKMLVKEAFKRAGDDRE